MCVYVHILPCMCPHATIYLLIYRVSSFIQSHYRRWRKRVYVGPGLGHRGWNRTKSPITVRGKRSSFVRHLIWLTKTIGFQVSVRVGCSPGSITIISWARRDWWSLSAQTWWRSQNRMLGPEGQFFDHPMVVGRFNCCLLWTVIVPIPSFSWSDLWWVMKSMKD